MACIGAALDRQAAKGALSTPDQVAALARLPSAATLGGLADCDLVVEATAENKALKKGIHTDLAPRLSAVA